MSEVRTLNGDLQDSNTKSVDGAVQTTEQVVGSAASRSSVDGKVRTGKTGSKEAVLYTPQELTPEQALQARNNIGSTGEKVTGQTFTPYTVDEPNGYAYIYDEPVEAMEGAEVFNCYDGDRDGYGSDRNIATGFMSQAAGYRTQALGNYSKTGGWWTRAVGQCAVAEGLLSIASGHFVHAEGTRTQATINNAHSEGDSTKATGRQGHSEGQQTVASGFCAHAEGSGTEATNYYSHSEGLGTIAGGRNQTAMGKYNIKDTSSLLIVGKGSNKSNRSNAFTVSSAGAGWFAGAVTSAGADYAEFFEWLDGNPDNEDRIGRIVTLEGDKIRFANADDDILGIVTGTAGVLGDNMAYEWKDKYITDNYGRIVYSEPVEEFAEYIEYIDPEKPETWITVKESVGFVAHPKVNPEYDPDKEYVSREHRKEWAAIGLLGKLYVNDDGNCVVGGYAVASDNGIVTACTTRTNMRVMKRITDNVVLVMMK